MISLATFMELTQRRYNVLKQVISNVLIALSAAVSFKYGGYGVGGCCFYCDIFSVVAQDTICGLMISHATFTNRTHRCHRHTASASHEIPVRVKRSVAFSRHPLRGDTSMVRMTLALCAALALSVPAAALAQDAASGTEVSSELHVSAKGLDLNSPAGARMMYARLQAAAYRTCHSDFSDPMSQNAETACVDKAMADAATDLQSPAVMALLSGPKSDTQLLAAVAAPTQLAVASDTAQPAAAVGDTGNAQPGSVRQPGVMAKAWHAVTSALGGK